MPEYAAYNSAVMAVQGTVDMSTGTIDVAGRPLGAAPQPQPAAA